MSIQCFLAPDPIQGTYFIPGGNTVANGGQVFFYSAGTSTKTTVYKDNLAGTAWSNPIVLDSGGNLPSGGEVWIPQGVTVKVVFAPSNDTDPPASSYWTKDNLVGTNDVNTFSAGQGLATGRLTTVSLSPVFQFDSSSTKIFYTPYKGNVIDVYDGSASWVRYVYSEIGMTVPTSTAVHDVYVTNSSGTLILTTKAWVNDSTRSSGALALQNGVLVNGTDTSQLYVGSLYSSSGTVSNKLTARNLYNYYNQISQPMLSIPSTATWPYSTGVIRQANNDPANRVEFVLGQAGAVSASLYSAVKPTTTGLFNVAIGIGLNTTTAFTTSGANDFYSISTQATFITPLHADYAGFPPVGRSTLNSLEFASTTGTSVLFGTVSNHNIGLFGFIAG